MPLDRASEKTKGAHLGEDLLVKVCSPGGKGSKVTIVFDVSSAHCRCKLLTLMSVPIDDAGNEVFLTIVSGRITRNLRRIIRIKHRALLVIMEEWAYRMATSSSVKRDVESSGSCERNRQDRSEQSRRIDCLLGGIHTSQSNLEKAINLVEYSRLLVRMYLENEAGRSKHDLQLAYRTVAGDVFRTVTFFLITLEMVVLMLL